MRKMDARQMIPGLSKPVSRLALGTAFYDIDTKEHWFDILDAFIDFGGTIIDSGRVYEDSEEVLGLWLESRSNRDRIILITKCGLTPESVLLADGFPQRIGQELTTSLEYLKTDHIDLYMLHRDNREMPVSQIMDVLNREIANGRVHALGASNWEYDRVTEANAYARDHGLTGFAAVSNHLTLALPTGEFWPGVLSVNKAGERWHEETGVPLISWSAQARGFLSGRYCPEMRNDPSRTDRVLEFYGTDENFERLRRAKELGEKKGGYSAIEVALAWLLHKPFPLVPIVGPQTKGEMASCVKATSLALTDAELKWLNLDAELSGESKSRTSGGSSSKSAWSE